MSELWRGNATRLGEELAREHFTNLPIDPFHIAEKLKIIVEPLPPDRKTVSGMLAQVNDGESTRFGIQYATYIDNKGFQKFCVAHELGHYHIPSHPEKLLKGGVHQSHAGFTSNDRCEQEADHFAAGLLMPSFLIDREINRMQSGLAAIESLSALCETSLTSTAIRFTQRSSDPLAIIVSEGATVSYCFMSDELREIKDLNWIRKGSNLPKGTVTWRFNQDNANVINGNRDGGDAQFLDWFNCHKTFGIYEEVLGLGQYGKTLTVLTVEDMPDQEEIDEEDDLEESWTPRFRR